MTIATLSCTRPMARPPKARPVEAMARPSLADSKAPLQRRRGDSRCRRRALAVAGHPDGRDEHVAAAADGPDELGVARILAALAAQPDDEVVDAAVVGCPGSLIDAHEQRLAALDLPWMGDQDLQQAVFAGGEVDAAIVGGPQAAGEPIDPPAGEGPALQRGRARAMRPEIVAPRQRLNSGQHPPPVQWPCDVVVGAE